MVKTELEGTYVKVNAYRYNFCVWEMSSNRDSTLDLIDGFLSPNLDIVTIQLGENCSDISTYCADLSSLIDYIRVVSPEVRIIIVDDFWDEQRAGIRQQVAEIKKCEFANLGNIRNDRNFQSDDGILCYMTDGSHIEVPKEAETHPGDKGMEYIAKEIINCIK